MPCNPDLLDILVCPQCKGELNATPDHKGLNCDSCNLQYEIRDDIPNMLIEDARPLSSETAVERIP